MAHSITIRKADSLPTPLRRQVIAFIESIVKKRREELAQRRPVFGSGKGKIHLSPDFDAPLDDFNEYM